MILRIILKENTGTVNGYKLMGIDLGFTERQILIYVKEISLPLCLIQFQVLPIATEKTLH